MGHEGGGSKPPTPSPRNAPALVEHSRWEAILDLVDKHQCEDDSKTEKFKSKMKECVEAWRNNKDTHTEVDLRRCDIGAGGAKIVGRVLECNPLLTKLELRSNQIGADGATAIGAGLEKNTSITVLDLDGTQIGDDGATTIGAGLEKNTSITVLYLRVNQIGADGATAIGAGLEKNTSITKLYLSDNQIGADGATAIGAGLEKNTSITVLDLQYNQIGDDGATAIGAGLEKNNSITKLYLQYNQIGDDGATAIGAGLEKNTSITVLYLQNNQIGADGATAIGAGLEKNTSITKLYLRDNQIGDDGATAIGAGLEKNTSITMLDLRSNQIGDDGATAIGAGLEKNTSITVLYLRDNQIGADGATALAKALRINTCLEKLDVDLNSIGDDGARAIAEALKANPTLKELEMGSHRLGDLLKDTLPPEIAAKENDEVLAFLRDLRGSGAPKNEPGGPDEGDSGSHGAVRVTRGKLLVVGPGGAGKSTLVRVLGGAAFDQDAVRSTDGMVVGSMSLPLENGDSIELSTWDFAGQEVYQTTHSLFLSTRCVYVMVWNMQVGLEKANFEQYLHSVYVKVPEAKVVVVGTHRDAMSEGGSTVEELQKHHPGVVRTFEVSCKSGDGMDELRSFLAETTAGLPDASNEWPRSYLNLEKYVHRIAEETMENEAGGGAMMNKRTLLENAVSDGSLGLTDVDQAGRALSLLHDWGSVVLFDESVGGGRFVDKVVVRPQWLADVMSALVTGDKSKLGFVKNGRVTKEGLDALWATYDDDVRTELKAILESFEMVFGVRENGEDIMLVPGMLGVKAPPGHEEWLSKNAMQGADVVKFEVVLPFVPFEFFPRLVHRLHGQAVTEMLWRNGLALRNEKNDTAVMLQLEKIRQAIMMEARGDGKGARLMVSSIKASVDALIRESYPGLRNRMKMNMVCPFCDDGTRFSVEKCIKSLDNGSKTKECQECDKQVDILAVLPGAHLLPLERYDDALENLPITPATASPVDREYHQLQLIFKARELTDDIGATHEKRNSIAGSLVWLPLVPGGDVSAAKDKVPLMPLCEMPGHWHPANKSSGETAVPKEMFFKVLRDYGKHIIRVARVISKVGLAGAADKLGTGIPDAEYCSKLAESVTRYIKELHLSGEDAAGRSVALASEHKPRDASAKDALVPVSVKDRGALRLCLEHKNEVLGVTAEDLQREKEEQEMKEGRQYAILIGTNTFKHPSEYSKLDCAESDVDSMRAALTKVGYVIPDEWVLKGENVTRSKVERCLTHATEGAKRLRKFDRLVVYFSGHASKQTEEDTMQGESTEGFVIAHDTDPDQIETTSIDMMDIKKHILRLKTRHAAIILDTCFSGFLAESFQARGARDKKKKKPVAEATQERIRQLLNTRVCVAMTAGTSKQKSWESRRETDAGGFFTQALVRALDPQGPVFILEGGLQRPVVELAKHIFPFVRQATANMAEARGLEEQTPMMVHLGNDMEENFFFTAPQ